MKFILGATTWTGIYALAIVVFLGFYFLQNSRRTIVAGLSVEAQPRTLRLAGLEPLIDLPPTDWVLE